MDINDLTLLIAAAEVGSFRKAAQLLQMDVAPLSRRIARLEGELGVLLFERGHAGVRLTVAGASTIDLARKAIADFEAIRRNAIANGRAERGRLRLGTHLSTIGPKLRALLKAWRNLHPHVKVELTEIDDRALLVGLRERDLDAIVAFCPVLPPEVVILELWTEPLLIALPEGHPLVYAERIGWREVQALPLLVRSWTGSNAYRELQSRLVGPGADFRPVNAAAFNLMNLVAIGEGAMFAMDYLREMAIDGVVFRPIDEPDATISVVLSWLPEIEDPVVGNFVAFMRDRAKTVESKPCVAPSRTPGRSP